MDNDNKDLEKRLKEWQKKAEEYLNGWKRAKADFINYKKDEIKRLTEISKFANEAFIKELLAVLDSFNLALAAWNEKNPNEKGVYLIKYQMENILKKYGLEKVTAAAGDQFDPRSQEVVAAVESDQPAGIIIEEMEAGYSLYGKLIRPVQVKVSK